MKAHGNYELPDATDVLIAIENGDIKFAEKTIWRLKKKCYNDRIGRKKRKRRRYDTERKTRPYQNIKEGN